MKIEMDMPLMGTYYEDTRQGDPADHVRALPLPFDVSYRASLISLDAQGGKGRYEIEIADSTLTPALVAGIRTFAALPIDQKRVEIAKPRAFDMGEQTGTFQLKKGKR